MRRGELVWRRSIARRSSARPSRVGRVLTRAEIRYLQIPTDDVDASAGFYELALGWTIRTRGDGIAHQSSGRISDLLLALLLADA
jgi:hypothetical protein